MRKIVFALAVGFVLSPCVSRAQPVDSVAGKVMSFPSRLFSRIHSRTAHLNEQLTKQTEKSLQKMAQREQQIQQRLSKVDPTAAQRLFAGSAQRYSALEQQIKSDTAMHGRSYIGVYMPYLDSLQGSLAFLRANPQVLSNAGDKKLTQLQAADNQTKAFEARLMTADQAKAYIQQRKQLIGQYIAQHAGVQSLLQKPYADINKEAYYYSQQVRAYKEMWSNPDQLLQKALVVLNRLPAFQGFMKANSMLGGLFNVPGSYGSPQAISGLQTKSQVAQLIQGQVSTGGAGGASTLQSNLQSAQGQLDTYKSKLSQLGTGNGDMDMPNFKPNDQKTKTFWKRLEYGADFQTTRNNYYFPMVTDFGVSLGYKLGHNNVIGLGASYKLGWGNGIQHISFTNEGVGLRSFLQIRIKGSFSATGGFEYNYTTPFTSYQQLKQIEYWTRSGLIGITKTVSLKNRVFKKTSVSLLWDFLSYQEVPKTQPILFRIGYNF